MGENTHVEAEEALVGRSGTQRVSADASANVLAHMRAALAVVIAFFVLCARKACARLLSRLVTAAM